MSKSHPHLPTKMVNSNLAELLTAPVFDQVRTLTSDDFEQLNSLIERELRSDVKLVREISHYIVKSGGKRLRPLVVLLAAKACGYQGKDHIKLATLVEFLHTATLLHDDVVDQSARRRSRRTANVIWGNAASILVGDFLYSRAFQLMVAIDSMQLMSIISEATKVIAEGEVLQLQNLGNVEQTESQYLNIIRQKTAMLFQAAAHTGSILGGANSIESKAFKHFGLHFGIAYQLVDDWLDYAGNSDQMGKNAGDDLAEGKATLPLIFAMNHGTESQSACVREAIAQRDVDQLPRVICAVQESGALDYVRELAERQTDMCIHALASVPQNEYQSGLEALANIAICRLM